MNQNSIKNRKIIRLAFILNIIMIFQFVSPFNAYAYIDPNTGGLFFTSILPFVYGLLAALVVFWKRIAHFVKGIFTGKKEKSDD